MTKTIKSTSYHLKVQEIEADYRDGYINKKERDERLKDLNEEYEYKESKDALHF